MQNAVPVEVPRIAPRPPDFVAWWTMVAPSRALRRGRIMRFEVGERPVVLFRGRNDGIVRALPAHCQHQGVDLSRGSVNGNHLRCPLHHWEYSDRCERIPGLAQVPAHERYASYVAAERYGMIFIHPGDDAPPIPKFFADDDVYFEAGEPVQLDCPWFVIAANAFDMTHLRTVHRRELTSEPETSAPDAMTLALRYSTSVAGRSWSDRVMRLLSGNHIEVTIQCSGGTLMSIEATTGRRRSFMLASLRPSRDGVSILAIYGVPRRRSGLHALHARAARLLFNAFLRHDVRALRGIRFPAHYVDGDDPTINTCYRFLCGLPAMRSKE